MNTIKSFIILSRPVNVIIAFITIFIAAGITGPLVPFVNVLLAAICVMFITIGANVINDYYDIEIDKINKPNRPLPSGKLSTKQALIYTIIVFVISGIIASFLSLEMFFVASISCLLLFLYSYKFKRTILWGNFIVSLISGMAFIFGGMAVGRAEAALFPAVFAFLFHFGREILKDIQDIEGDKNQGIVTFPIKYGTRNSIILVLIIFIILILVTIIPYILHVYGFYYLLIVVTGVHTVLVYVLISSWNKPKADNFGRLSTILKIDMLIGLLAIYAG